MTPTLKSASARNTLKEKARQLNDSNPQSLVGLTPSKVQVQERPAGALFVCLNVPSEQSTEQASNKQVTENNNRSEQSTEQSTKQSSNKSSSKVVGEEIRECLVVIDGRQPPLPPKNSSMSNDLPNFSAA